MADRVVVCVGTRRGLFVLESGTRRERWTLRGPWLKGWEIHHATVDPRGAPRILAAANNDAFASTVFSGDLQGRKFDAARKPPAPPALPPAALRFARRHGISAAPRIWHVEPGPAAEKDVLYAGAAPASLFRSEDRGRTWKELAGLTRHPTRKHWMPGGGGLCLHSIQVDPADPRRLIVAVSAAGAFLTRDGGASWTPANQGVAIFPGAPRHLGVGTCVHKLLAHPAKPGRLFQQNHVGVYRSDDFGASWSPIHRGLPTDFGFGLALDANDPDACYTIPLVPEEYQWRATQGGLRVWRWDGRRWTAGGRGLPDRAYVSVLREGMGYDRLDPGGVYFGTGSGHVFASRDAGRSWSEIAAFLPPIRSVSASVL